MRIAGPFRVTMTTDRLTTVRASGSSQALEQLRIETRGGLLVIRLDRTRAGANDSQDGLPAEIVIRAPAVREAFVQGSGSLLIGDIRGLRTVLGVEGSGSIVVARVAADSLEAAVRGAGQLVLQGRAKTLRATSRGTGRIQADGLVVDDLAVTWESAGQGHFMANRAARVDATGGGDVTVRGSAACQVRAMGTGRVLCGR